ncbi:hypothetical protein FGRMN_1835 [Fusarium graminum]|nr:hypothetical protein FGRMN_1835 [Fusarium graminum]
MTFINTNGWDTVFAIKYSNINQQIKAQWPSLIEKAPSLANITGSIGDKVSVNLNMSEWQLSQGGTGSIVRLTLPITTGSYKGYEQQYDLAGQSISLQLALQWVPQPTQIHFAIEDNVSEVEKDLNGKTTATDSIIKAFSSGNVKLSAKATIENITKNVTWKMVDPSSGMAFYLYVTNVEGTNSMVSVYQYVVHNLVVAPKDPITPVTVISAGNITHKLDGPLLKELITENIDRNLEEFKFVFATVDVVTQLCQSDVWAWLQPTSNAYAVSEPLDDPTNDNCVFAVLSMVNNRTNPKATLQVDAQAIAKDCTSSLLISPYMFLHNMLAPSVSSAFKDSKDSDFHVNDENLSVTNTNPVVWENVEFDDNKKVQLSVNESNFAMTMQNDRITMSFSNLNYPMTSLGITVGHTNIMFSGQFKLGLHKGSNGNQTLWFDVPENQPTITNVSVVMTDEYYLMQKIIGWILIALSAIWLGGTVGKNLSQRAAKNALQKGGVVEANATAAEVAEEMEKLLAHPPSKRAFIGEASASALESLSKAVVNWKMANSWGVAAKLSGKLAMLTGGIEGGTLLLAACLRQTSQHRWEETPSFGHFANRVISRYTFAGLKTFQLESAGLAGSLQIGFTAAT